MIPLLLAIGGGAVAGLIVMVQRKEKERTAAIQATAARLGWSYRGSVPFKTIPDLDRFELFTQGRRRTLANLMTSPAGEPRAALLDYSYTTGGGNSQSRHHQTVFYAIDDTLQLPTFSLRPQRYFHTIAKMFGYQDIDIVRRPLFSDMFILRGDDEVRVSEVFSDAVMEFFETHEGVCAAGVGREVLYWRPGRRVNGEDVEAFVNEGRDLVKRLARARL